MIEIPWVNLKQRMNRNAHDRYIAYVCIVSIRLISTFISNDIERNGAHEH